SIPICALVGIKNILDGAGFLFLFFACYNSIIAIALRNRNIISFLLFLCIPLFKMIVTIIDFGIDEVDVKFELIMSFVWMVVCLIFYRIYDVSDYFKRE
ncbi:hypothetical protein EGH82_22820, partial [Vibrio ponticus]